MDTVSISVVEPAQVVTINVTAGFGNVTNSDGSYNDTVNVGQTLVIPDSSVENTDGTYIFPLPATQTHIVPDTLIENSDSSWQTLNPAVQAYTVPDSVVSNSDDSYIVNLPATIPLEIPDSNVQNSDGTYDVNVPATRQLVLPDSTIHNSDNSYTTDIPATTDLSIPDITVSNSDDSFSETKPAAINIELSDVTHIDTDETAVVYPAAKPFTCTPPVYKWYGIEYDITATSPDVTRINSFGDDDLHYTLPIQSGMRACLLTDAGTVNYWLDPNDWSKKIDGAASNLDGTDGQVMIYVPRHYRKFETSGNTYRCKLSMYPIAGFHEVPAFYIGAFEASVQRSTLKLASVVNATADYRGGNNNAAWDAAANTLLGKPVTLLSRTNFRTYARNRAAGTNWNINTYEQHKTITWLFVVEYATRNSQKAVDATLTTAGYKKGGLGNGVTTANSTEWNTFNTRYPFINCGASNSLATKSGEVSVAVTDFGGVGVPRSFTVNRYRGIEMPFGHIWKNLDGVNVDVKTVADGDYSRMYVTNDPTLFNDANYIGYSDRGLVARSDGYVKTILDNQYGEIIAKLGGTTGANAITFWCDYNYQSISTSSLRTVFVGGTAAFLADAGITCMYSGAVPTTTGTLYGTRLSYIP